MKRAFAVVGVVLGAVALFWVAFHVVITKVNPAQESPSGHFQDACWACHIVTSSAAVIDE